MAFKTYLTRLPLLVVNVCNAYGDIWHKHETPFPRKSGILNLHTAMKKTPVCREEMQERARKRRYCGESLSNKSNEIKDVDNNLLTNDQNSKDGSVFAWDITKRIENVEKTMQKLILDDGFTYYGQVANEVPSGYGVLSHPSGCKFEGLFYKGLLNGEGTKTFDDGKILSCKWQNGKIIDEISIYYPDGSQYIGKINGYGTFYTKGSKISAYWGHSEPIGKVTWIYPDNSKYEGEMKNFRKHGKGVFTTAAGASYEGDFVNDRLEGFGTLTEPNGRITSSGLWKNNQYLGKGKPEC